VVGRPTCEFTVLLKNDHVTNLGDVLFRDGVKSLSRTPAKRLQMIKT